MIRFACPNCEKVYSVPDSAGGKAATCKQCGTRFQIPDPPPAYEVVEEAEPEAPKPVPPPPPPPPPPPLVPPPPPPPVPPPTPPPVPVPNQLADTMVLPAVPDPSAANANQLLETLMLPALPELPPHDPDVPAIPDLLSAPPPTLPPPQSLSFAPTSPPPPAPAPVAGTVDLQPCPTCGARLTVNAEDVGAQVECPMCKTVFEGKAAPAGTVVTPVSAPADAAASTDVDIAPCPKCKAELTVSESDLGNDVECPYCQTVYKAERPQAKSGTLLAKSVRRPVAPPPSATSSAGDDSKKRPYEFKPKKGKKDKDSPFQDEDEDDDDRPSKRSKRREDDEDDDDDRPRRKKKRKRSYDSLDDDRHRTYAPHDGVLNLVLSLVAFFFNGAGCCCTCVYALPPILAIYVIIKSSLSLSEVKKGIMDPSGATMLQIARVIAIVALLLTITGVVIEILLRMGAITLDFLGDYGTRGGGGPGGGGGGGFRGGRNDDF